MFKHLPNKRTTHASSLFPPLPTDPPSQDLLQAGQSHSASSMRFESGRPGAGIFNPEYSQSLSQTRRSPSPEDRRANHARSSSPDPQDGSFLGAFYVTPNGWLNVPGPHQQARNGSFPSAPPTQPHQIQSGFGTGVFSGGGPGDTQKASFSRFTNSTSTLGIPNDLRWANYPTTSEREKDSKKDVKYNLSIRSAERALEAFDAGMVKHSRRTEIGELIEAAKADRAYREDTLGQLSNAKSSTSTRVKTGCTLVLTLIEGGEEEMVGYCEKDLIKNGITNLEEDGYLIVGYLLPHPIGSQLKANSEDLDPAHPVGTGKGKGKGKGKEREELIASEEDQDQQEIYIIQPYHTILPEARQLIVDDLIKKRNLKKTTPMAVGIENAVDAFFGNGGIQEAEEIGAEESTENSPGPEEVANRPGGDEVKTDTDQDQDSDSSADSEDEDPTSPPTTLTSLKRRHSSCVSLLETYHQQGSLMSTLAPIPLRPSNVPSRSPAKIPKLNTTQFKPILKQRLSVKTMDRALELSRRMGGVGRIGGGSDLALHASQQQKRLPYPQQQQNQRRPMHNSQQEQEMQQQESPPVLSSAAALEPPTVVTASAGLRPLSKGKTGATGLLEKMLERGFGR